MKMKIPVAFMLVLLLFMACGKAKNNGGDEFPENFGTMNDAQRVAFVMKNCSPDSVARFICSAALGKVKGARIDTLANATLYAYENYPDTELVVFSEAFDSVTTSLPLADKMKIISLAGMSDPQGLGYELGLEYVGRIRDSRMNAETVEREIEELRKVCASDTMTFRRFLTGFQTALRIDHGNDFPEDIYNRFINYK